MASCNLRASHIRTSNLYLGIIRARDPQRFNKGTWTFGNLPKYTGLMMFGLLNKKWVLCCSRSHFSLYGAKESVSSNIQSGFVPDQDEVKSLITGICETDSVAEFELKMDDFHLYLTRDLVRNSEAPPSSSLPPASLEFATNPEETAQNGAVPKACLAIPKPMLSLERKPSLLERAANEGFAILQSPKASASTLLSFPAPRHIVGFFRRSRTIKGKRAPPACEENQIVKEGQVLCYIDQLGGEIPIESDVTGEIIEILLEDGEPIGYDDALIKVLPSFPGIKKLQ
ncbi:uncharacterized protein LOC116200415 [Punica granatum]|uniref:Uncharacterized protein LOC116200415 n=1 Tax=Punica granatum TaxID=22663 RepID=A0A6P8D0G1_PUNGR|nr:uncharacterized protein LOC116200415 [Punica granatum]